MNDEVTSLIDQMRQLEQEIERRLRARSSALGHCIEDGRIYFERSVLEHHRALKTRLVKFLREAPIVFYLTAPVIYALIVPLALLDVAVTIYQRICFPAWGIARVRRAEFIVMDRHRLAYLNAVQKLNCSYCSYANGVIAYAREIASRTEQYWCPIKHAMRRQGVHDRYREFLAYGDGEGFVAKSALYRARLKDLDQGVAGTKS